MNTSNNADAVALEFLGTNAGKTAEHSAETKPEPPANGIASVGAGEVIVPGAVASASSALALGTPWNASLPTVQPIADVAKYLRERKPVAHYRDERPLFIRLPAAVARETKALLAACELVESYRRSRLSVSRACVKALGFFSTWNWKLKTFRAKYDLWQRTRDWFSLVNRSKAGAEFQEVEAGLPEAFLAEVEIVFGAFKRSDGKRQALMAIERWWRTGRDHEGRARAIPGYADAWDSRNTNILPPGWHRSNLRRQIKARGKFNLAVRALLHDGEASARAHLPQNLSTRRGLRFLEHITFDDVRTDWLIFNTRTGKPEELWLLVARCTGTAMVLGFVMHPASEREDGRCTHLGLAQMKQLAGWLLERYPLPPYRVTWKIERGTATLNEAMKLALGELLGHRIAISYTSMIGGTSPAGYRERAKGNSRGKASHESHNRLFHTQGSFIPGQTGNRYDVRPQDLNARADEAVEIWSMASRLPAHLQGREKYPLLTLNQAREHLFRICSEQNSRTDHRLEDFEEVLERIGDRIVKRMEMPIERAARLAAPFKDQFTPVSPDIVAAFYEHTEKVVAVEDNGEISFDTDGRRLRFRHGGVPLVPGTKALAYFHPDDPKFVHLTDGKGAILGTWIRRDRVAQHDRDALAEAMHYTHVAREAAREAATALAAPEREQLDAMRRHNAELMRLGEFTDVAEAPRAVAGTVGAPAGAALTAVSRAVKQDAQRAREHAADLRRFKGDVGELVETPTADHEPKTHEPAREDACPTDDFSAEGLL